MRSQDFFDAYIAAARRNELSSDVPWQVTLAQVALESGWGAHAPGNNFFGIKADPSWSGKSQMLKTRDVVNGRHVFVQAAFRVYDTPFESFADHAAFLRRWKRYAAAFETRDPRTFAGRVAAAGYATDPNYAAILVSLIDQLEALAAGAGGDPTRKQEPRPMRSPPPDAPKPRWLRALRGAIFGRA